VTLKVGMDVTPLTQTHAGTARYIKGLMREFAGRDDLTVHAIAFGGGARAWNLPRDAVWYPYVLGSGARGDDVLHCPTYRGPIRSRVPLVVTVHDLAVFRHPRAFNRWSRTYGPLIVPRVLRAARLVIAVSEFTKGELIELLSLPEEKIRVVHNGIDETFRRAGPSADGDYALAVGTLEPRKNLARIAAATRRTGLELRVVGARGWGNVEMNGDGVRWLGDVPDDELARLYRGARCFVYASLYEGFGIPVLEAMACGTPVVTSRGGGTEEVANGAAVLVDPRDPSEIATGIERAVLQRDELVRRGRERAHAFTWGAAADATVDVYREAAA
jgi:glycosyltransferase involved in cell wall biosynthesis